jgi:DNA-binding SARP family transcriptional activator/tetratricopeptide (TPR) repeat protein
MAPRSLCGTRPAADYRLATRQADCSRHERGTVWPRRAEPTNGCSGCLRTVKGGPPVGRSSHHQAVGPTELHLGTRFVSLPGWATVRPVQFRLLGRVEVVACDGRVLTMRRRQERILLAALLLDAGRAVSVERLCDLLWEHNPPQHARRAVHTSIARIRALLAAAGAEEHGVSLTSHRTGYLLKVAPETVDAHQFRAAAERGVAMADPAERDRLLREALALWRGPALADTSDRIRQRLCVDLDELRLRAVEERAAAGLALGRGADSLPELARLTAEHPYRERLVELHMLALHRTGRTADAIAVYTRTRTRLAEEIGLDPGPALQRVHEAILRGDPIPPTGPSPRPASPTPAQLPADLAGFAGRSGHLRRLDALLSDPSGAGDIAAVVVSAIAGTAGVGKTALAVHWAHRVRHRFPDGQLYVNLRGFDPVGTPLTPAECIRGFLDALDVPPSRIPASLDAQIGLYRSLLADRRVLVLLDNARTTDQVRPLIPGGPGNLAVVTSRNRLTGLVATDGAHPLALDLLTRDEAHELLARRIGDARVDAEPDATNAIVDLCAGLPLALAVVAARAATEPAEPLNTLVEQLRDARTRLDAVTGDDTATDIRAVFSWTYRALSPAGARMFRLLGLHPGPDVTASAAASLAAVAPDRIRPLLAELVRNHLLSQPMPGRYTLHDLLRAYAIELTATEDTGADRRAALHRLLDHYLHTAHAAASLLRPLRERVAPPPAQPGVTPEHLADHDDALAWFTAEHRVLHAAILRAADAGLDTYTWQIAWAMWDFLDRRGLWHEWTAIEQTALDLALRLGDRPGQARAHRGLGSAAIRLDHLVDAHANLERALDLYMELGDHNGQAHTHHDLALVLGALGRPDQALSHGLRNLDLHRRSGNQRGEANALNLIGWFRTELGEHPQALADCRQALVLLAALDDREGQSATWDTLGYIHHHLGEYADAITCYRRALGMYRDLGDRFYEADTLRHIGDTYQATGSLDAAREAWHQALVIFEDLGHPQAHIVRASIGR